MVYLFGMVKHREEGERCFAPTNLEKDKRCFAPTRKNLLRCFSTVLYFFAMNAVATPIACPDPQDITRINGEYAWQSHDSLFEGFFAAPQYGRGQSSKITQFLEARWIQLTDLADPQGFVECDYAGNVSGEVIRFSLLNAQAGPKPNSTTWSCGFNPPFPSSQCVCFGDPGICTFEKT